MKSYTDIEQSKKLAKILPLESADMWYPYNRHLNKMYGDIPYVMGYKRFNEDTDFPCWSLSALMNLLPEHVQVPPYLNQNKYRFNKNNGNIEFGDDYHTEKSTNLFDAVFEMICWLKEDNKL